MTPWPTKQAPADYTIGHVHAVLPDRVIDDARMVVRAHRIVEVAPQPSATTTDLDGRGLWCLPGLVDVHSDVFARAACPRPGAQVPVDFAFGAVDDQARAVGITTTFHGAAFQERTPVGTLPDGPDGPTLADAVRHGSGHVLHRLDVRSERGGAELRDTLMSLVGPTPALVSHEDHTPGQGQYADPATMVRWHVEVGGMDPDRAARHTRWWQESREESRALRDTTLEWLGVEARAGRIRLMGHDPATRDDVAGLVARGGAVAEFPTTVEAAAAARDSGLLVVAGAPNVVRAGSHTGNVSARELVQRGLVDALASDYLPAAMLGAVRCLTADGVDLPAAVGLVTAGPARVAGLADRGRLAPGQRADLVLVDPSGPWPRCAAVLTAER